MRVMLDIDGCLASFTEALDRVLFESQVGAVMAPLEGPQTWDWFSSGAVNPQRVKDKAREIMSDPWFWSTLTPTPEGRQAEKNHLLWDLTEQHEVFLITQRDETKEHYEVTLDWLQFYYPSLERCPLILINNKVPLFDPLHLDIIIDDHPGLVEKRKLGQFKGRLFQPSRPYNRITNLSTGFEICGGEGPWSWMEKGTLSKLILKVLEDAV